MKALLERIHKETDILTPNRRLSATIAKFYQQEKIENGEVVWETPEILPLPSFLEKLWHTYNQTHFYEIKTLISPMAEQYLWEKILTSSKEGENLLQIAKTADIVRSAYQLLIYYQVDIENPIFQSADDYIALYQWINAFNKICADKNIFPCALLPQIIIDKVKSQAIKLPKNILLVGFNDFSPLLLHLFNVFREMGTHVEIINQTKRQIKAHKIKLKDKDHEIFSMAHFAKAKWQANKNNRIGLVIPNLEEIRARVLQIFMQVFSYPENHLKKESLPFNISAGAHLADFPIIKAASIILNLYKSPLSLESFSQFLLNPFLGYAESEYTQRATFDSQLRQNNINQVDLSAVCQKNLTKKQLSLLTSCPLLGEMLNQFLAQLPNDDMLLTYGEWAQIFLTLLSLVKWPGERSLSSEEYQTVDAFLEVLAEFNQLDFIAPKTHFSHALNTLNKILNHKTFQSKTPDANIQILGLLEASHIPFDYLWIGGMDDISQPPQVKPNPFIPKKLQRELNMPHATALREYQYAKELIEQFKNSAKKVIFSYPEMSNDGELNESALISDLPAIDLPRLNLNYQLLNHIIYAHKDIEVIQDESAPPISNETKISGGVSVLKQQAACPFKAYSEWLLFAKPLEEVILGLRARDRGTLIHAALEWVWKRLKNHTNLVALNERNLEVLLTDCIDIAFNHFPNISFNYSKYAALEKKRLHELLMEWLNIEKERTYFKVLHNELRIEITINQLPLIIKIDRIDELEDGSYLIIDYKTGKYNDINSWLKERMDEPQLPLYAITKNCHGIAFAQVALGSCGFKGISAHDIEIKGIKPITDLDKENPLTWEEQMHAWEKALAQLSHDFLHGIAPVDPKNKVQTCLYCQLQPFCRIYEEVTL